MIALIDYGSGNLQSAGKALEAAGGEVRLARKAADLAGVSAVVLPGVGAFGDAAENLASSGMKAALLEWLRAGKPFFGICVGYQLLFASSEESPGAEGLGFLPGRVVRFRSASGLKVPHMGWNRLATRPCPLWDGLPPDPYVYFVHSYFPQPADEAIIAATTEYGETVPAAIWSGSLAATQFHPEKSQETGLRILRNWLAAAGEIPSASA